MCWPCGPSNTRLPPSNEARYFGEASHVDFILICGVKQVLSIAAPLHSCMQHNTISTWTTSGALVHLFVPWGTHSGRPSLQVGTPYASGSRQRVTAASAIYVRKNSGRKDAYHVARELPCTLH